MSDREILEVYAAMAGQFAYEVAHARLGKQACYRLLQRDCGSRGYRGVLARALDHVLEYDLRESQAPLCAALREVLAALDALQPEVQAQAELYLERRLFNCPRPAAVVTEQLVGDAFARNGLADLHARFQEPRAKPCARFGFVKDQTLGLLLALHRRQGAQ